MIYFFSLIFILFNHFDLKDRRLLFFKSITIRKWIKIIIHYGIRFIAIFSKYRLLYYPIALNLIIKLLIFKRLFHFSFSLYHTFISRNTFLEINVVSWLIGARRFNVSFLFYWYNQFLSVIFIDKNTLILHSIRFQIKQNHLIPAKPFGIFSFRSSLFVSCQI